MCCCDSLVRASRIRKKRSWWFGRTFDCTCVQSEHSMCLCICLRQFTYIASTKDCFRSETGSSKTLSLRLWDACTEPRFIHIVLVSGKHSVTTCIYTTSTVALWLSYR
jgi:hypothetical protein